MQSAQRLREYQNNSCAEKGSIHLPNSEYSTKLALHAWMSIANVISTQLLDT